MEVKHRELLYLLLNSETICTARFLGKQIGVSSRTINNYVSEINALSKKTVIMSSRLGYSVNTEVALSLLSIREPEIPQAYIDRARYIIRLILIGHETPNIDELADTLFISPSTLKSELRKYNLTFQNFNVRFEINKNSINLIGEESDKRKLASYVLYQETDKNFIDLELLNELFGTEIVEKVKKLIATIGSEFQLYITNYSASLLLQHLLILFNRVNLQNNRRDQIKNLLSSSDDEITLFIENQAKDLLNINLSKQEQFEILLLFKTCTVINQNYDFDNFEEMVGKELVKITKHLIEEVKSMFLIDLSSNAFIMAFSIHLKNLKKRTKLKKHNKNPMFETIKRECPLIYDIAVYMAFQLKNEFNFSSIIEDEISFLALHIGCEMERKKDEQSKIKTVLLCPEYLNVQLNVYNHLMYNHGNEINIIKIVDQPFELNNLIFDLLISTVEIKQSIDYELCCISPLMLNNHISTVNNKISYVKQKKNLAYFRGNFSNYFSEELFFLDSTLNDKVDVINFLCDELFKKGYVEKHFLNNVLERENMTSTAFNFFAIPHPIKLDAIKTSIAILISKTGVLWDNNVVNIVLLPAITDVDKVFIEELYSVIYPIFSSQDIIQSITQIDSFENFKQLLLKV